jgi:hypothetical protein
MWCSPCTHSMKYKFQSINACRCKYCRPMLQWKHLLPVGLVIGLWAMLRGFNKG